MNTFSPLPRHFTELHARFAESAKLEHLSSVALAKKVTKNEVIKANLSARRARRTFRGRR